MVKETKFFRKQAAKAERVARTAWDAEISERLMPKFAFEPCLPTGGTKVHAALGKGVFNDALNELVVFNNEDNR